MSDARRVELLVCGKCHLITLNLLNHILHLREIPLFAERRFPEIPGSSSILNPASRGRITYGNTFVLHPLNSRYQDMEVKKGEFQIIGRVVKKEEKTQGTSHL